mmetsp:Transcript_22768/g.46326  ORF Transcript_22768/g.46326 Transcript_22768/m.46326 type:complete len:132 (-) Transcript_22768:1945-2340(-)
MDSRHCDDGSPATDSGCVCRAHTKLPKWMRGSVKTLSMDRERFQQERGRPKTIYGGYGGLKREMRRFFANAPKTSKEVSNKWKADRERVTSASSVSNMVFNRDRGNWSSVSTSSSQEEVRNENPFQKYANV